MKLITLFFCTFIVFASKAQSPILIFESGYEGTCNVIQQWKQGSADSTHADIEGVDNGWDWESTINNSPHVGFFAIRYETLDTIGAKAEIIPEPNNPSNNVLRFKMTAPNVQDYNNGLGKGRIQGVFTKNDTLRAFHIKEKLLIHEDFDFFTEPQFDSLNLNWMTIQEFWNNNPKDGEPYPFRVTLNIRKPINSDTLYFGVHAQTKDTTTAHTWNNVWNSIATSYPIPLGSWLDIETYFVEGDSLNGKFKFIVTDTSGVTHTIFDIIGFTHHPLDPNPDGIKSFNPMKLYTFGPYIDTFAAYNKCLCLYWDDLELWKDIETLTSIPTKEENLIDIVIYPNPFVKELYFKTNKEVQLIEVYNMMGTKVYRTYSISKASVNLDFLSNGLYFVKFTFKENQEQIVKVIKN